MNVSALGALPGSNPGEDCNIRVVCRVRPLNDIEKGKESKFVVKFHDDNEGQISLNVSKPTVILLCDPWKLSLHPYPFDLVGRSRALCSSTHERV